MINDIRQIILVSRPISWVNTAYPFAAAYLLAVQAIDWRLVVGTLFFLIPYNLLMYGVNDVFDYESDMRNSRKGGIEGALAAKRLHAPILVSAAATSLPFIAILLWNGTLASNMVLLGVLFFVLAYSAPKLRFKERPLLDSITSSLHFVGPLIYALSVTGFSPEIIPAVAAFFMWGMASHAFGAVQDITPDKQAGIASIATALGARQTVRFAITLYAASGVLLSAYILPIMSYGIVIAGLYVGNIWQYRSIDDKQSALTNAAWRRFIYLNLTSGFLLTLLLIMLFR